MKFTLYTRLGCSQVNCAMTFPSNIHDFSSWIHASKECTAENIPSIFSFSKATRDQIDDEQMKERDSTVVALSRFARGTCGDGEGRTQFSGYPKEWMTELLTFFLRKKWNCFREIGAKRLQNLQITFRKLARRPKKDFTNIPSFLFGEISPHAAHGKLLRLHLRFHEKIIPNPLFNFGNVRHAHSQSLMKINDYWKSGNPRTFITSNSTWNWCLPSGSHQDGMRWSWFLSWEVLALVVPVPRWFAFQIRCQQSPCRSQRASFWCSTDKLWFCSASDALKI